MLGMGGLQLLKIGGIVVAILVVCALMWTVRAELIEKGKNLVYADDNAARVKAQEDQSRKDALLIASQASFIADLQNQSATIKERIVRVAAPCAKDGADDARLRDVADWLRSRGANDSGAAPGGPQPKAALPPPSLPARSR